MRRYTNWSLLLVVGLLTLVMLTSDRWIPKVQPLIVEDAVTVDFDCPRFVESDQCKTLRELYVSNPELAEHLRDSLDPENDLEVLNEPTIEELAEDLNPNTSDEPVPSKVKTGSFQDLDTIRRAKGVVSVYEFLVGDVIGRYLSFEEEFRVNNAPDLTIYLSKDQNLNNLSTGEQLLTNDPFQVGFLRGNFGTQHFQLDRTLDLTLYRSVVIYSAEYDLIMAIAPIVTN